MSQSQNFNVFLLDGGPNSRVKYTSFNWVGVAYKLFRVSLEKCKDRPDLKYSGVYFLFGNSNEFGKPVVYIGQADVRKNGEGILNRLMEHKRNPNKDYWSEAVVFITSNNSLGPTEISYLEHEFCRLAREINRYDVKNGNDPTPGNLIEEKKSELNTFIENAKLVMSLTGHQLFTPLDDSQIKSDSNLYLTRTITQLDMTVTATGRQTNEGFVVLKGSRISPIYDDTLPALIKEQRKNTQVTENQELLDDKLFNSPSYAAMFVIGKSANGLTSWKTKDGKTLKDIENSD